MSHPALTSGRAAVVVGAASGIGLAAAKRFAGLGMKVCLADQNAEGLEAAVKAVAATSQTPAEVFGVPTDVSDADAVNRLRDAAYERFGEVAVLMNNAGIGGGGGAWEHSDRWRRLLETNLWGVINGLQAFTSLMLDQATPCAIINTGSKQGITNPPGDVAYNTSKAAVKALTEGLAHQLRNVEGGQVSAHLLIPGYTFTGMTARSPEKPPGAWSAEQVVDFMIEAMGKGDFYILCPDNDVTREIDEKRMRWAADDLILNRPALSRWDPAYKAAFETFMASKRGAG
ncbi:MAG: SDR family NAD(P)-dependent oxidoreductase [Phenylobacterium sp.]|uniref:SDR family NAD(P)-dependent oxidoreductase n=1 Tax=Phenylobacterium sp. TaxID=1871053 RepID=UPI001B5B851B|nr:SDR family NAD(P)-dependent oxidoreductase [Phenylobacterium sp.]MBP7814489.1 SDR family NAD(P)-dependent oxidoreductase [Phenylobacterium sp.]MBP9230518.1 SDR family NAD(P)-dependent oxidoreductase [Phenylobacterium sp.]MBP9754034.1 SDR family NAD(P)-dependent oxidoreductase [Phenylobacterium sp.]